MRGADQCPRCGSDRVNILYVQIDHEKHAYCRECRCMWEPFSVADLSEPDDRFSAFKTPCDNCAFRPGSPEREDPDKWQHLQEQIHLGGAVFYCHKGVPVADPGEDESHDHFKKPDGTLDLNQLRLCAGYLATRLGHIYKQNPGVPVG